MKYTCHGCADGACAVTLHQNTQPPVCCPAGRHQQVAWTPAPPETRPVDLAVLVDELLTACLAVRTYLEERGCRKKGVVGRTRMLPMLDSVIGKAGTWAPEIGRNETRHYTTEG